MQMTQQVTKPLNTNIELKLSNELETLHKKTRLSKRVLIEEAIKLLLEQHRQLTSIFKNGEVDKQFINMVDAGMKKYEKTMRKLAE